jgi:L-iditol 2-dehydrogenase
MRAAVLVAPGRVEVRDLPEPELGEDDVLIAPRAVGICGSDLHLYRHGRIGTSALDGPIVLGHEPAGEVVAVGARVETLRPGDRAIVEPGISCGACFWCHRGAYNPLADVSRAIEEVAHRRDGVIKAVVELNGP